MKNLRFFLKLINLVVTSLWGFLWWALMGPDEYGARGDEVHRVRPEHDFLNNWW